MNEEGTTPQQQASNIMQCCGHCGLPLTRCAELGSEAWRKLWDETVDSIAEVSCQSLTEA